MATVYSLICWGGKDGKAVTVNATTDLVTLTNHGLRNSKGVQFVSGTLPTVSGAALAMNTDYYAKWISSSTFELYYDSALTSKIDFTSTGASLVMKGSYYQGLSDTSRWGTRIYDGRVSWNTARTAAATVFDTEVVELDDDFDDLVSATWICTIPAAAVVMTSMVNGARGNGWHGGVIGNGYVAAIPNSGFGAIQAGNIQDFTLDGFSVQAFATSGNGIGISTSSRGGNTVQGMIISGADAAFGTGVVLQGAMTIFAFNLITKIGSALSISLYTYGALVANNTIVGNKVKGIFCSSTSGTYGKYFNNISFGNTGENWQSGSLPNLDAASNNAGASGDTVWTKGGGSTITVAAGDFANYAGGDFRPASALSALFDSGTDYYGRLAFDLADAEVPNYNNGGAEGIDLGCFEFNNGYGPHPASHTLTLTNVVVGSRILVRDQNNTTTHFDQIATGTTVEITVTVYGDSRDNWRIKIRKASAAPYYQAYETLMTAAAGSSSIYVNQLPN